MEVTGRKRCSTDCRECRDIIHSEQQDKIDVRPIASSARS